MHIKSKSNFSSTNTTKFKIDCHSLKILFNHAKKILKLNEDKKLNLIFVNNKKIREINKIYRKKDKSTDVISFAFNESQKTPNENLLGEIYISIDTAKKQAKELNHSLKKEIKFLFIHGLLHIYGYDHRTNKEENIMNKMAEEILK
jgi:probable rRNA maturation factor